MLPLSILGLILLGVAAGFIVNYLADVLPYTRGLSHPTCHACQKPLPWRDYLSLRPCPECGRAREIRVWVTLAGLAAGMLLLAFLPGVKAKLGFWPTAILMVYAWAVAVMDIEHRVILHPVSLAGALLMGAIGLWRHGWLATLEGGAAGFGIMFALFGFGMLFMSWLANRRKPEPEGASEEVALGFGDVNLGGALGLLLGWPAITAGLMAGILLAGLFSLGFMLFMFASRKINWLAPFAYGPFLLIGGLILILT